MRRDRKQMSRGRNTGRKSVLASIPLDSWVTYGYVAVYIILCTILLLGLLRPMPYRVFDDTVSYTGASYTILHGSIDSARTPVYPLLIAFCRAIFGEVWQCNAVVWCQSILFVISVVCVTGISRRLGMSRKEALLPTALYALFPGVYQWQFVMLTEGLTISFMVFFLWSMLIGYPGAPNLKTAIWSGVWLMLLIYLRPVSICLIPVYIIYWGWMLVKWNKTALKSVTVAGAMLILVMASLAGYKSYIKSHYGFNSLTYVSIVNNYFTAREAMVLLPRYTDNIYFRNHLDSVSKRKPYNSRGGIADENWRPDSVDIPYSAVEKAVNHAIADHPVEVLKIMPRRALRASRLSYVYMNPKSTPDKVLQIMYRFGVYTMMIILIGTLILMLIKPAVPAVWLLWLASASFTASCILGAMGEWDRLTVPVLSAVIILFCYYIVKPQFARPPFGLGSKNRTAR